MAKRSDLFSTVGRAHPSDDQLALLAQDGDRRAMEWLLDRYRPVVEGNARDYFWAGADAEDVVQEGMIGLYKAVRDYSPGASISFRSFARLCIRRQIITALKAATRHKHTSLNSSVAIAEYMSSSLGLAVASEMLADRDSGNPERIVISRHIWADVRQLARRTLSQLEWQALVNYMGGAGYQDIAQQLGCSAKQIDNALQRAKKKIVGQAPAEITN